MPFFAPASMAMLADGRAGRPWTGRATPSPRKLHGLVQRAVHADHADDVQDDVLAADTTGLQLCQSSTNLMAAGTLNQALPVAIPAAMSVEPTPVENAPSAP